MGNSESGEHGNSARQRQKKPMLDQIIISAKRVKRKLNSFGFAQSGMGIVNHVGIQVITDENEEYVIHHPGPNEDVKTVSVSSFGSIIDEEEINVRQPITIRQAEYVGGKGKGYLKSGMCIGVADKIQERLENR